MLTYKYSSSVQMWYVVRREQGFFRLCYWQVMGDDDLDLQPAYAPEHYQALIVGAAVLAADVSNVILHQRELSSVSTGSRGGSAASPAGKPSEI